MINLSPEGGHMEPLLGSDGEGEVDIEEWCEEDEVFAYAGIENTNFQ